LSIEEDDSESGKNDGQTISRKGEEEGRLIGRKRDLSAPHSSPKKENIV